MISAVAISGALIAGAATGLGALPIYFKREFSKRSLDVGLGFSAGVMLVASFLSLIVPGIESSKQVYSDVWGLPVVLVGLLTGYLFIILVHDYLPHEHMFKESDMLHKRKMSRMALVVWAIALHNFPEGLAVGVGFGSGDEAQGLVLAAAIGLQNIPEGLVVALGLLSEGASKNKAFVVALLSGLVEPVAAMVGLLSSSASLYSLPIAMGFAGGTMLFVICQEILPELFKEGHEKHATLGVIFGVMTMFTLDYYF